ncbi:inosine/uridine-preferring nucleoside hydrolase [Thozetella sp. PMI_491]|nr:inosine/uridine-preferring nucleoside hydrolase [Thozetella sp. PMI_491]
MKLLELFVIGCSIMSVSASQANETKPSLKVIIDTDFNTIGDDGQTFAMAAQLHAAGSLELLGLTIVTGNQWLHQGVSDCLKAVERMGLEHQVGVYIGTETPFLHDYASFQLEKLLFGNATHYVGAYLAPQPQSLVAPPDGFATHTIPQIRSAVQFIIDSAHRYPGQLTILAIGPLTNIAIAMRQDPSIIPLIREIVIMGGQIYAPGNSYIGAGETNWWFDPESARVVLRANVPRRIVPLDATNTVPVSNETYDSIANYEPATPITTLFKDIERWGYVYDTIALVSLLDPSFDLDVRELYVDVSCDFNANYGKGIVWSDDPYPGMEIETLSAVVFGIDNARFFDLYVDLLTRPVPVVTM